MMHVDDPPHERLARDPEVFTAEAVTMTLELFEVDAFTKVPFSGNPAAVCLLDGPAEPAWMQSLGAEMNLSETAFVWRKPGEEAWQLRWFTPYREVDLCGHATLASAHILWQTKRSGADERIVFETRSGRLSARRTSDDNAIELDFPATPATPCAPPSELVAALGIVPAEVARNEEDYLVELPDLATLHTLDPDFRRLAGASARGVMVTTQGNGAPYDFVSRFFAPACGIDEDPVTGSAHCTLGPYWAQRLGKSTMHAYQASPRGGELEVECRGDRVRLRGHAVTVWKGALTNAVMPARKLAPA